MITCDVCQKKLNCFVSLCNECAHVRVPGTPTPIAKAPALSDHQMKIIEAARDVVSNYFLGTNTTKRSPNADMSTLRDLLVSCPYFPIAVAPSPELKWHYFYKNDACPVETARDSRCICWHAIGSGPLPHATLGDPDNPGTCWTERPVQVKS